MAMMQAYLIHLTHYDPVWITRKAEEAPFDLPTALAVVDAMVECRFNHLIIACSDGVQYASHPELTRPYSVPMETLQQLVVQAKTRGLEIIPKLNFSQSTAHQHNHWFRPHNGLFDSEEYWEKAFEVIDEILAVCGPVRYFHIVMDEDQDRSYTQYVQAICRLHAGLHQRGVRPVIWNDTACDWPCAQIHVEKSLRAEAEIPRDVVQVLWNYWDVDRTPLKRILSQGFETWLAPANRPELVTGWQHAIQEGEGSGLVMTTWKPCHPENHDALVQGVREFGGVLAAK